MEHTVIFAGLSPHPPVIIPEIGGERLDEVAKTVEGIREVMRRLVASAPEAVVVISPHAPRDRRSFSAYTGPRLRGDFSAFRAPSIEIGAPNHVVLLSRLDTLCRDAGLSLWMIPAGRRLDHGAMVPLYFLMEAGWRSPLVVLGLPFDLNADHFRFGECISDAARQLHCRIAIIASGDMSHRLTPDAPYEHHPRAHVYDEQMAGAVAKGDVDEVLGIDPNLRELAGEDTYQSLLVALGATGRQFHKSKVCSYEGPFGVGYLTAVLADYTEEEITTESLGGKAGAPDRGKTPLEVLELARRSVEIFLKQKDILPTPELVGGKLAEQAGVFVCIKNRGGELRGCVGTVVPMRRNVAEEIIHNAMAAATEDARFDPVRGDELDDLLFSVDILSPLEEVSGVADLDPACYGIVVESDDGRRGVLLPDLVGIERGEQQVELAMRKARMSPGTPVKYHRFTVERMSETSGIRHRTLNAGPIHNQHESEG